MNVATILKGKGSNVITIHPDDTIADAARLLHEKRIGAVLVMEDDRVAGIISERDLVRALAKDGAICLQNPIRVYMTTRVAICSLNDSLDQLMNSMTEGRFRHLPVVEDGRLIGLVSIGDVVKHRIAETEMESEAMRLYIASN